MAKIENLTDRSISELMASRHSKEAKREMIEYFRGKQNMEKQIVEMVATQQEKGKKDYPNASQVLAMLQEPDGNIEKAAEKQEKSAEDDQYVFITRVSWTELQPFKALSTLSVTDWLLVAIAILLLINIIRKK